MSLDEKPDQLAELEKRQGIIAPERGDIEEEF